MQPIKTRPHWAMLVQLHWIAIWVVCIAVLWALYHPQQLINLFHLTTATPGIRYVTFLYGPGRSFATLVTFVVMFLTAAGPWTWWAITTYTVADGFLTWNVGPFSQNQIPLAKIQDTQMVRGTLALLLGYGTIMIDSGRAQIYLPFVPKPYDFRDSLQWKHTRDDYSYASH